MKPTRSHVIVLCCSIATISATCAGFAQTDSTHAKTNQSTDVLNGNMATPIPGAARLNKERTDSVVDSDDSRIREIKAGAAATVGFRGHAVGENAAGALHFDGIYQPIKPAKSKSEWNHSNYLKFYENGKVAYDDFYFNETSDHVLCEINAYGHRLEYSINGSTITFAEGYTSTGEVGAVFTGVGKTRGDSLFIVWYDNKLSELQSETFLYKRVLPPSMISFFLGLGFSYSSIHQHIADTLAIGPNGFGFQFSVALRYAVFILGFDGGVEFFPDRAKFSTTVHEVPSGPTFQATSTTTNLMGSYAIGVATPPIRFGDGPCSGPFFVLGVNVGREGTSLARGIERCSDCPIQNLDLEAGGFVEPVLFFNLSPIGFAGVELAYRIYEKNSGFENKIVLRFSAGTLR